MPIINPPPKITVRQAQLDERTAAAEIAALAFAQLGAHLAPAESTKLYDQVRATTTNPEPGQVIIAVASDRVIGSVVYNSPGAGQQPKFPADWAFFRSLGVAEAWAGQGIGRRLVEECIVRARRDGAKWIGLFAADVNDIAVRLYVRMGFKVIGGAFPRWGTNYRVYGLDLSGG